MQDDSYVSENLANKPLWTSVILFPWMYKIDDTSYSNSCAVLLFNYPDGQKVITYLHMITTTKIFLKLPFIPKQRLINNEDVKYVMKYDVQFKTILSSFPTVSTTPATTPGKYTTYHLGRM